MSQLTSVDLSKGLQAHRSNASASPRLLSKRLDRLHSTIAISWWVSNWGRGWRLLVLRHFEAALHSNASASPPPSMRLLGMFLRTAVNWRVWSLMRGCWVLVMGHFTAAHRWNGSSSPQASKLFVRRHFVTAVGWWMWSLMRGWQRLKSGHDFGAALHSGIFASHHL